MINLKCGENEFTVGRWALDDNEYFRAILRGGFKEATDNTITVGDEWKDALPKYAEFLTLGKTSSRIGSEDWSLAMYFNDTKYMKYCDSAPKLSNKLCKRLRHNSKLSRLHPLLDQKNVHTRIYYSDLSDDDFYLIVKHWPDEVPVYDAAQEWVYRKGTMKGIPLTCYNYPRWNTIEKWECTSLWAYWFLFNLEKEFVRLREKGRLVPLYTEMGRLITLHSKKVERERTVAELSTLLGSRVDDSWLMHAVHFLKYKYAGYLRDVHTLDREGMKLKLLWIHSLCDRRKDIHKVDCEKCGLLQFNKLCDLCRQNENSSSVL